MGIKQTFLLTEHRKFFEKNYLIFKIMSGRFNYQETKKYIQKQRSISSNRQHQSARSNQKPPDIFGNWPSHNPKNFTNAKYHINETDGTYLYNRDVPNHLPCLVKQDTSQ